MNVTGAGLPETSDKLTHFSGLSFNLVVMFGILVNNSLIRDFVCDNQVEINCKRGSYNLMAI